MPFHTVAHAGLDTDIFFEKVDRQQADVPYLGCNMAMESPCV